MANRVQTAPTGGDFELGNNVELTSDTVPVALALTVDEGASHPDLTYNATAPNNPEGGNMEEGPGLVYTGPAGTTGYFVVAFTNADAVYAAEGIADPDGEDTVSVDIFVNATAVITSDEGQSTAASEGIIIEFNGTAETVALTEGDVLRFGLQGVAANQATRDWDLNEGGEWSVQ